MDNEGATARPRKFPQALNDVLAFHSPFPVFCSQFTSSSFGGQRGTGEPGTGNREWAMREPLPGLGSSPKPSTMSSPFILRSLFSVLSSPVHPLVGSGELVNRELGTGNGQ